MKKLNMILIAMSFAIIGLANGPEYSSEKTKEVIEKMVKAHGGMERWSEIKTMSFTTAMYSESLGLLKFWINDQVVEMNSRRTYQDWPLVGSQLSYDGNEVWTNRWNVGNPPAHQQSVNFYYLNLPWLTQSANVRLGEVDKMNHPAFEKEVYSVKMSFKDTPTIGKSKKDTYTLYIDVESYLLIGYEYTIGYGPLLDAVSAPSSTEVFGPLLRKNYYIADLNGVKLPLLFSTHSPDGKAKYGDHAVYNIQFDVEFDESRMMKSESSVIDPAVDKRK